MPVSGWRWERAPRPQGAGGRRPRPREQQGDRLVQQPREPVGPLPSTPCTEGEHPVTRVAKAAERVYGRMVRICPHAPFSRREWKRHVLALEKGQQPRQVGTLPRDHEQVAGRLEPWSVTGGHRRCRRWREQPHPPERGDDQARAAERKHRGKAREGSPAHEDEEDEEIDSGQPGGDGERLPIGGHEEVMRGGGSRSPPRRRQEPRSSPPARPKVIRQCFGGAKDSSSDKEDEPQPEHPSSPGECTQSMGGRDTCLRPQQCCAGPAPHRRRHRPRRCGQAWRDAHNPVA